MSGPARALLAARIQAGRPGMEVLFMSGYTGSALALQSGGEFGSAFLAKPFTPDGLSRRVREVLDA